MPFSGDPIFSADPHDPLHGATVWTKPTGEGDKLHAIQLRRNGDWGAACKIIRASRIMRTAHEVEGLHFVYRWTWAQDIGAYWLSVGSRGTLGAALDLGADLASRDARGTIYQAAPGGTSLEPLHGHLEQRARHVAAFS